MGLIGLWRNYLYVMNGTFRVAEVTKIGKGLNINSDIVVDWGEGSYKVTVYKGEYEIGQQVGVLERRGKARLAGSITDLEEMFGEAIILIASNR